MHRSLSLPGLRRGFASQNEQHDFPVRMCLELRWPFLLGVVGGTESEPVLIEAVDAAHRSGLTLRRQVETLRVRRRIQRIGPDDRLVLALNRYRPPPVPPVLRPSHP